MQLCGNGLAAIYFRSRGSFPASFCPMFIAFLAPMNPLELFANSWLCFIKRPCLYFDLHPVSIAWLQSEIDTGENLPLRSKKPNQQIHLFAR